MYVLIQGSIIFWIDEYVSLFVDDVGASHELLKELGVFFNSVFVFH